METPDLTNVLAADAGLQSLLAAAGAGGHASSVEDVVRKLADHRCARERVLFPALAVRCAAIEPLLDRLTSEHRELETLARALLVQPSGCTERALLARLQAGVDRHLDVEHNDLLPLFYRHFDADEFAVLDAVINQHQQENRT